MLPEGAVKAALASSAGPGSGLLINAAEMISEMAPAVDDASNVSFNSDCVEGGVKMYWITVPC